MATQVQFRRGTTTENNAFTGAAAELTVDTTLTTIRVHDGTTAGGIPVINTSSAQTVTNKTFGNGNTWQANPPTLAYGGTGKSLTAVQGGVVYTDSDSMEVSLAGTAGQILTSGGTAAPIWVTPSGITVGTASVATSASNITGGSAGYLVYQFDTDDTAFIEPGAVGTFLRSTGASTAPNWATADITIGTTVIDLGSSSDSLAGVDTIISTGTAHWTLPVGTTAQRPGTPADGMVRYNTSISSFEGYGPGNAWGSLGGVKDVDQDTYLLTEASAGSDEDTFEFYNADTNTASLDVTNFALKNDVCFKVDSTVSAHPSHSAGQIFWCPVQKTVSIHNDISGVSNQLGHEEWVRVYNGTGSTITNGTPVYATGQNGGIISVAPADATTAEKAQVIGIATHDISAGSQGVATVRGLVNDFDTSALTAGSRVHVGSSGALQTAAPTYPYFPTDIGTCVVSDASTGCLYVYIQEHVFEQFRVTGNTHMSGNLTVAGDFTVQGTQTITSQANLALDNAFIYMNSGDTIGEANTTFSGSGLDDAYFTGHFEGTSSTNYYVRIDGVGSGTGGVDTFEWSKDNFSTTEATGVDLSTTDVALDNNIKINFNATTGHTSGDTWSGTAAPLNTDTGWASNRNTGGTGVGYTHIGVVWDTASSQFIVFDEYSPEIEGNVDTAHASFSYGSMRMDDLTAVDGTFSGNGSITGTLTVTGATTMNSNLDLNGNLDVSGNITSSSGAISFGDENLSTTGTLSAGNSSFGTITGSGALTVGSNSITAGSLDISGNADIDGTMEADAYTVNGTALNEYIADTVGAMVGSNTESGISVTYQDADNTLDFDVDDFSITLTGDVTGSGTVTNLGNVSFAATIQPNSVALGTDTTGNYMVNVSAGTGVSVSHTQGEGSTATVSIGQAVATSSSVTFSSVTAGTLTETSDERLKTDIQPLSNALETIKALDGKAFIKDGKARIGLIAQEVEQVLPQVVDTADDALGTKSVAYGNIVAMLIEAIKEQQVQIDELKAKLGE